MLGKKDVLLSPPSARTASDVELGSPPAPTSRTRLAPTPAALPSQRKTNPESTASIFSRLSFSWLFPLMSLGATRALEHADLYELLPGDTAAVNCDKLTRSWEGVRAAGGRSFFRACHRAYGRAFWLTGLLKLINDGCIFLDPFLIYRITDYIADNDLGTSTPLAFAYALSMFGAIMALSLAMGQYFYRGFRIGLNLQVGVAAMVFRKALVLPYEEQRRFGIGPIVSYMQACAPPCICPVTCRWARPAD